MKALVLAAGRGSRLGEHSQERSKCMLRFLGKPLLQYSLENAVRARVQEIVLVVGYRAEEIINEFGNQFQGVRIRYVIQHDRLGTVHAFECSQEALAGANFMLFLADEILLEPRHSAMLQCFDEQNLFVVCGVVNEPNRDEIRKTYAIIQNDSDRRIYRIIEKPRRPPNDLRGTGNCIFRNEIFEYLTLTPINPHRNEKELPDLIQCAIDDGHRVTSFDIGSGYININTPEDIMIAERSNVLDDDVHRQVAAKDHP